MQFRGHVARLYARDIGNVFHRHVVVVVEREQRFLVGSEPVDGSFQQLGTPTVGHYVVYLGVGHRCALVYFYIRYPLAAQVRYGATVGNAAYPRVKRGMAKKTADVIETADESILNQLFGILVARHEPWAEAGPPDAHRQQLKNGMERSPRGECGE